MKLRAFLCALLIGGLGHPVTVAAQTLPPVFPISDGELRGLVDREGRVIVPPEYEELKVGDPLILVRKAARVAYLDFSGRMVINPQAELVSPFSEGLAPAMNRDVQGKLRYGYVDAARKVVIAPAYAHADGFVDG